jgi:hypothetical protein
MVVEIRKQKGGNCAFSNCKRKGYVVLTEMSNKVGAAFYHECKKHFTETVDMRNWNDNAKRQFEQLTKDLT